MLALLCNCLALHTFNVFCVYLGWPAGWYIDLSIYVKIKWVEETLGKPDLTASIHSYIKTFGARKARSEGSY